MAPVPGSQQQGCGDLIIQPVLHGFCFESGGRGGRFGSGSGRLESSHGLGGGGGTRAPPAMMLPRRTPIAPWLKLTVNSE